MSSIFQELVEIGRSIGDVTSAHLYDNDFISIEGKTKEGKRFSLTLNITEEVNNND